MPDEGHGHYWQVQAVEPGGQKFTARVMAGDQPLDDRVLPFAIDTQCRHWHGGKLVERFPLAVGDKLYITWVLRGEQRIAQLMADDASLEAIKQEESARVRDSSRQMAWREPWTVSR